MTSRYSCSNSLISAEALLHLVQAGDEPVDLFGERVEVEARACRRRDPETRHQRLGAVVPGANRDALPVEYLRDVVRVDPGDVERDDSGPPLDRRAEHLDEIELGEPGHRADPQPVPVGLARPARAPPAAVD